MTEQEAADKIRRAIIGLQSRSIALTIYGCVALFVGALMATTGAPGTIEEAFGPASRVYLGAPLALSGALILIGSFRADTTAAAWVAAVVGTAIFGIWCFALAGSYMVAAADDGFYVAWPNETIPRTAARPYVPFLYFGIGALITLHMITLIRLRRPNRVL